MAPCPARRILTRARPMRHRRQCRRVAVMMTVLVAIAGILGLSRSATAQVPAPAPGPAPAPPASAPATPAPIPTTPTAPQPPPAAGIPAQPAPQPGTAPAPTPAPAGDPATPAPTAGDGAATPPAARPAPTAPANPGADPAAGQPDRFPTPSPGSSPTPPATTGGGDGWFDWLDIPGRIARAINNWFSDLIAAALQPMLRLLGRTVLSTPDITAQPRVVDLWHGSVVLANSLFLLILTVGGIAVMGYDSVQTRATAKELAPRMVIGFAAANLSLTLLGIAIRLANALSQALTAQRIDATGTTQLLLTLLLGGRITNIFLILLSLVVVGLAAMVVVGWIVRITVMMLLAVAGPLLLIWHGLPWTEGAAALWWRAVAGCLAIQIGQSLLIILGLQILLGGDGTGGLLPNGDGLVNILVAASVLYVAIRLQSWVAQLVLRGSGGRPMVLTLVRYRLLRAGLAAAGIGL
ncbi:hypothetical protein [Frankia sp. CiP3]|uniref:hypothetical protein n=1 Tax=Frankia sp. CiP3 TaxID=2880971 RepID=UPI001EF69133|nr:hypothetical protein [Frankia sp. CiP3]